MKTSPVHERDRFQHTYINDLEQQPMNMKKWLSPFLLASAATLLLAACADTVKPADDAITAADNALADIAEDAKQYVPLQYNEVLGKLNGLKTAFNKKNYKEVVAGAPDVMTAVKGLGEAATAKRAEAMQVYAAEWEALSVSVPAVIASIQDRGAALETAKKVPDGVDLVSARRAIADANMRWKQAQSAGDSGRTDAAVINAKKAQERAELAARYLKLPLTPPKTTPKKS